MPVTDVAVTIDWITFPRASDWDWMPGKIPHSMARQAAAAASDNEAGLSHKPRPGLPGAGVVKYMFISELESVGLIRPSMLGICSLWENEVPSIERGC